MKIAVLSLNPAIDLTVFAEHFTLNQVNRAVGFSQCAGGKGVNVASFLSDLGMEAVITGFLGVQNSAIFEELFARKQIEDLCIRIPGMTRTGIKIADEAAGTTTDINFPGLAPAPVDLDRLEQMITRLADECEWMVMTGSLPPGIPLDTYGRFIQISHKKGQKTILDTSGAALKHGLLAGPWLAKPNLHELQEWSENSRLSANPGMILHCIKDLFSFGTRAVVVSMGEEGALYISPDTFIKAVPPPVAVISTVGAGDAMVAGMLAAQVKGLPPKDSLQLATACSLAAITTPERDLPGLDKVMQLFADQVRVSDLKST